MSTCDKKNYNFAVLRFKRINDKEKKYYQFWKKINF